MRRIDGIMVLLSVSLLVAACGGGEEGQAGGRGGGGRRGGGPGMMGGPPAAEAAVPIEAATVVRRTISSYIETNGTLEAENEVDIVARVSGPIVELEAEETMLVRKGDLLARIDPSEIESQLEISRVALEEARIAFDRAERLSKSELVSAEEYDNAKAAYDSAVAQFEGNEIQLGYTEIRAPFDGLIIDRYVKFAQHIGNGDQLFRISDFDPLLSRIQVPERNLPQLRTGQRAYLMVEAWPEERFEANVLRLSPVVDAATGTVRVTLEVAARGKLRPGMFASVFLETETRDGALVIPRKALALESIGDTVYVVGDGVAERRAVTLGFREGDSVEVVTGVEEGEQIVSVGQDGLSDGTPIQVLVADGVPLATQMAEGPGGGGPPGAAGRSAGGGQGGWQGAGRDSEDGKEGAQGGGETTAAGDPQAGGAGGFGGQGPDFSKMTPEQREAMIERIKERMRSAGMTDEQIEQRIEQIKKRAEQAGDSDSD